MKFRVFPSLSLALVLAFVAIGIMNSWAADIYIASVSPHGFSLKHGTAEAPYVVRSMLQLKKVLEKAPDGSTIRFAKGVYSIGGLQVTNKSLTFQGSGDETILYSNKTGEHLIQFSGSGKSFCVKNLQMVYSGGWADSGIADGILVCTDGMKGNESINSVILNHVTFRELYNAIYVMAPLHSVKVDGCNFLYRYGRAGVSNKSPFQHPAVAVLASGTEQTILRNCYFNGLIDPSFHGIKGNPPQSQRTPMDGFCKIGGRDTRLTIVEHNLVENHGIEGILYERRTFEGSYTTKITGNKIIGPVYKESSFYGNYYPAIVVANTQGAEITKNAIIGSPLGVDLKFSSYSASNACILSNNSFMNVIRAAAILNGGTNTVFCNNRVLCSSEPAKSVAAPSIGWCGLVGVAASGTPIIRSNSFQALEPAWDVRTELLSRSENVFQLSTALGIVPNQGVLISLSPKGLAYFPVESVKGSQVNVAPEWAGAFPGVTSGELVYARSLGCFTSLGAVCSFGPTSRVLVEGNRIQGFIQDLATANGGKVVALGNKVENVTVTQPESEFFLRPQKFGNVEK